MATRKNTHLRIGDRVSVYVSLGSISMIFKKFDWMNLKTCRHYYIKRGKETHILYELLDALVVARSTEFWFPITTDFRKRTGYKVSDLKCVYEDTVLAREAQVLINVTSSERNWLNMNDHRLSMLETTRTHTPLSRPFFVAFKGKSDRNELLTDDREDIRQVGLRMK